MLTALIITFFACLFIGGAFALIRLFLEFVFYLIISIFEGLGSSYTLAKMIATIVVFLLLLKIIF